MSRVLPVLAGAGAIAAASLHDSLPLMPSLAATFGVSTDPVAALPAATHVGFTLGIGGVLPWPTDLPACIGACDGRI
jgi:hypothetical protein